MSKPDLTTAPAPADVKPGRRGDYLTVAQVAPMLGLSVPGVYRLCRTKRLAHLKVGAAVRIHPTHVAQFLRHNTVVPVPAA